MRLSTTSIHHASKNPESLCFPKVTYSAGGSTQVSRYSCTYDTNSSAQDSWLRPYHSDLPWLCPSNFMPFHVGVPPFESCGATGDPTQVISPLILAFLISLQPFFLQPYHSDHNYTAREEQSWPWCLGTW